MQTSRESDKYLKVIAISAVVIALAAVVSAVGFLAFLWHAKATLNHIDARVDKSADLAESSLEHLNNITASAENMTRQAEPVVQNLTQNLDRLNNVTSTALRHPFLNPVEVVENATTLMELEDRLREVGQADPKKGVRGLLRGLFEEYNIPSYLLAP